MLHQSIGNRRIDLTEGRLVENDDYRNLNVHVKFKNHWDFVIRIVFYLIFVASIITNKAVIAYNKYFPIYLPHDLYYYTSNKLFASLLDQAEFSSFNK